MEEEKSKMTLEKDNKLNEKQTEDKRENTNDTVTLSRKNRSAKKSRITILPYIPALITGLAIGILVGFFIGQPGSDKMTVNEKVYRGAIYASAQDHKSAGVHLAKLTEKEIEKMTIDERKAAFHSHMLNSRFDRALDVYPDGAEELITHLRKKDNIHMVKNISSTLPPIAFEKAAQQKRYKRVLELKDKVEVTEPRQRQIAEALIMTGKLKDAVKYVKKNKMSNMKLDMEQHYNKYVQRSDVTAEQQAEGFALIWGVGE